MLDYPSKRRCDADRPEQTFIVNEYESRSDGTRIQLRCECGNWLKTNTQVQRVDCECGKTFAVTVTDTIEDF